MAEILLSDEYAEEIKAESASTRHCLERVPLADKFKWKPHEKSMELGYLALLTAEIPKWIADIITIGEIDLATYPHKQINTVDELLKSYDENIAAALQALKGYPNDRLFNEDFSLKQGGNVLFSASKKINVSSSINHWVHHRGQLTVYLRLNDISVPSIYGPTADERTF